MPKIRTQCAGGKLLVKHEKMESVTANGDSRPPRVSEGEATVFHSETTLCEDPPEVGGVAENVRAARGGAIPSACAPTLVAATIALMPRR